MELVHEEHLGFSNEEDNLIVVLASLKLTISHQKTMGMHIQMLHHFSGFSRSLIHVAVLLVVYSNGVSGFGSMGPISAAAGSGRQDIVCWGKNSSLSSTSSSSSSNSGYFDEVPPIAALSGGEGFICGILANTSLAYCWSLTRPGADLVPSIYQNTTYSQIAAGKNHVCAIRGSYYSDQDSGSIDCWEIVKTRNSTLSSKENPLFYDQTIGKLSLNKVVSGDGFSCGSTREGRLVCWGPNSSIIEAANVSERFLSLASARSSVCGILQISGELKCWGDSASPPSSIQFVSLTAGAHHFCGIHADNHGVSCWGSLNLSSVPKRPGFMAIASSDYTTCGIREDDLLLGCWSVDGSSPPIFDPPLELCSPGLCSANVCGEGNFKFNASMLNEPDLTSLCVKKDLSICSPCGSNCSEGFFLSSPCTVNADRVCTACSLCQNSSCWDVCKLQSYPEMQRKHWHSILSIIIVAGSSTLGLVLFLLACCFLPRILAAGNEKGIKTKSKSSVESDMNSDSLLSTAVVPCPGAAQIFRLTELKDATNGFKEFNELGRGSYGFVYKAILADGRVVAVKRANATTIIHTNNREVEMDLEILCNLRHCNVVNLLGYSLEMGERLLVYEYMPHGTLNDHLHSGLFPLNWNMRLRISMQAAKGLEYLHKEVVPPIVHMNVKSSNILLDSEWGARIADFGLITSNEKDPGMDFESDVYDFGVVLLEILSGRKAYDRDFTPADIVDWAVPLIKQGKAAAVFDRSVALPRNVEPLLKLGDIAELAVREKPIERPKVSILVSWLEQIAKGVIL